MSDARVIEREKLVINAITMKAADSEDYETAKAALKRILDRNLDPIWTFKDRPDPIITWESVRFTSQNIAGHVAP